MTWNYNIHSLFNNKKSIVSSLIADLELVKEAFDSKNSNRVSKISLLKSKSKWNWNKSLSLLQEKSNALAIKSKMIIGLLKLS
jgi:hypothetical protein